MRQNFLHQTLFADSDILHPFVISTSAFPRGTDDLGESDETARRHQLVLLRYSRSKV